MKLEYKIAIMFFVVLFFCFVLFTGISGSGQTEIIYHLDEKNSGTEKHLYQEKKEK